MQLDAIFTVILSLVNIPKMKLLSHIFSLAFQNNCGYAFTKHRHSEEALVAYPNSPSCLSLFSCMCPNAS